MSTATEQRDHELIRLCKRRFRELCDNGEEPSVYRIVLDVLSKPAPSYFVDFYHATSKLRRVMKEDTSAGGGTYYCSKLWSDMARDLKALQERHPLRSFQELVLELCVGTAGHPRFYITPRRAVEIVKRHLL